MRAVTSVLVVKDFAPFRAFVSTLLREKPGFLVVSEASDGLEAVRSAAELNPDLIFMDIGLPRLNGIEAACRIRELAPRCGIVFLTQESSTEVVEEALSSGALGYVHKARIEDDLFPAATAALEGKQFVSNGLVSQSIAWG